MKKDCKERKLAIRIFYITLKIGLNKPECYANSIKKTTDLKMLIFDFQRRI